MSQSDEEATTTPKKTTTAPSATAATPPSPLAVTKALDAELSKHPCTAAAAADSSRISAKHKPPPHSEEGSRSSGGGGGTNNNNTAANNLPRLDCVHQWSPDDVVSWAKNYTAISESAIQALNAEQIDGEVLLILSEDDVRDFRYRLNYKLNLSEMKKLWVSIRALQQQQQHKQYTPAPLQPRRNGSGAMYSITSTATTTSGEPPPETRACGCLLMEHQHYHHCDTESPPMSVDGRATNIPPEFFKTTMSVGYSFLVTWITSFVMVIVHERVPDMKRYPPLPDIFLDNVPHIPWAFHMCEITGTLLFLIWLSVIIFHKYRMVLLRRFFALAGTVFLLRCVTMLITSLSVPGTHLQCNQADYAVDDSVLTLTEALGLRISRAYIIWSGLGMSIQGVRTCGDYMFSGHTVALTLLNFFITEYTPRNLYFLHTLTWLMNMFGIFFILAAHEHYSIDVFVAFYITSRLFLYYHTLANNQALMSHDSNRTRIWFPMFSYFESSIDGIIPNEYDTPASLMESLFQVVLYIKDLCMLTARRIATQSPRLTLSSKNVRYAPSTTSTMASMHSIPPTPRTPSTETIAEYKSCTNAATATTESSLLLASLSEGPAESTLSFDTKNQQSAREKAD